MPRKGKKQPEKGTLIRGADGALYFVSDGDDWASRLPDEYTADARALLDEQNFFATKDRLPSFHGSGLVHRRGGFHEIKVELNRLAALIKRKEHSK
jgi:hypothetical protein